MVVSDEKAAPASEPNAPVIAKRLVLEAIVAKRFVVVAFVVDAFVAKSPEKVFCAVQLFAVVVPNEVERTPPEKVSPLATVVEMTEPALLVERRLLGVPVMAKAVVVALVAVRLPKIVEEALSVGTCKVPVTARPPVTVPPVSGR